MKKRRVVIPNTEFVDNALWMAKWGVIIVCGIAIWRGIVFDRWTAVLVWALVGASWVLVMPMIDRKIRSMHEDIIRWEQEGRYDKL